MPTDSVGDRALLRLLAWLSPGFPTGGFSYSHGIEAAVAEGWISDENTLGAWLDTILRHGTGRSDTIFLAEAWRAVAQRDAEALATVAEEAAALRPTAELALECGSQGQAFLAAIGAGWPELCQREPLSLLFSRNTLVAHPVAVGACGAAAGVPLRPLAIAFLHAVTANLASAGLRLIPLGQRQGLAVVAGREATILEVAAEALAAKLDDVGGAAWMVELMSIRHETLYTRLFRS